MVRGFLNILFSDDLKFMMSYLGVVSLYRVYFNHLDIFMVNLHTHLLPPDHTSSHNIAKCTTSHLNISYQLCALYIYKCDDLPHRLLVFTETFLRYPLVHIYTISVVLNCYSTHEGAHPTIYLSKLSAWDIPLPTAKKYTRNNIFAHESNVLFKSGNGESFVLETSLIFFYVNTFFLFHCSLY